MHSLWACVADDGDPQCTTAARHSHCEPALLMVETPSVLLQPDILTVILRCWWWRPPVNYCSQTYSLWACVADGGDPQWTTAARHTHCEPALLMVETPSELLQPYSLWACVADGGDPQCTTAARHTHCEPALLMVETPSELLQPDILTVSLRCWWWRPPVNYCSQTYSLWACVADGGDPQWTTAARHTHCEPALLMVETPSVLLQPDIRLLARDNSDRLGFIASAASKPRGNDTEEPASPSIVLSGNNSWVKAWVWPVSVAGILKWTNNYIQYSVLLIYHGIGNIAVACWTPFLVPKSVIFFHEITVTPWAQFAGDNFLQNLLTTIAFVPVHRRQFFAKSTQAYMSMRVGTHALRWSAMLGRSLTPPNCHRVGSS